MAALITALTLPDICGKARDPQEQSTRKRYIEWYDEQMALYVQHKWGEEMTELPVLDGELVYSLRCSLLHQGNPNIGGHETSKYDSCYFELLWNPGDNRYSALSGTGSEAEIIIQNGHEKRINQKYSVNLRELCLELCDCAITYYATNKDKFNFFNYSIESMSYRTRRVFGIID